MATLRCPHCGTLNRDDAVDFPLCRQCHERLVQCGYCRQFERGDARGEGVCRAKGAGGPRPARAEDAPECEAFEPRYVASGQARKRPAVHPAAWILGIFAAALIGLFAWSATVRPQGGPGGGRAGALQVEVAVPYPVEAGRGFGIDLTARNMSDGPTGPLRLVIPGEFAETFALERLEPAPVGDRASETQRWFQYPSLQEGEWLRVRLRVTAPEPGDYELRARLVGTEAQPGQEVRAPIRVAGGRAG